MSTEAPLADTGPDDGPGGSPTQYEPPQPASSRPRVPLPPDGVGYRLKRTLLGILTVAVSVAAGSAALTSTVDSLEPYRVPIALFFIALIAYGNLRGVRESGRIFAAPTYFFMANMALLLGFGIVKWLTGDLPVLGVQEEGMVHFGDEGTGLLMGASAFVLAKAFASGGSAVTGVEAISNGVPAFHKPEWRNARQTLVIMGSGLAVMFLGLSFLASRIKVAPFEDGTPTVLAQIGEVVYGSSAAGEVGSN